MCGIVGLLSQDKTVEQISRISKNMAETLSHRGPDASGVWTNKRSIGFGHRRLAINDLSPNGQQPMTSSNGRYTICFNGEIYNFKELTNELLKLKVHLKGCSDTEVFLEYISVFGMEKALSDARGMFAFGLWDAEDARLFLARDRLGEKPLYYGKIGNDLVFTSELKAAYQHPGFIFEIDAEALSAFVKYSYVPAPLCIISGFKKLKSASYVSGISTHEIIEATPTPYWSAPRNKISDASVSGLETVLRNTIKNEMISDVPIGCFLSGGIDSSLVSALMQENSMTPIETFTIGFSEKSHDESEHARMVAGHLGTNHNEWIISQSDVIGLIPSLPQIYDEPFADPSQLPTTMLARMTQKSVTVCLSGDGGDELFCGYDRYLWMEKIQKYLSRTPAVFKNIFQHIYKSRGNESWDRAYKFLRPISPIQTNNFSGKLEILHDYCSKSGPEDLYDSLLSCWTKPHSVVRNSIDNSIVQSFNAELTLLENLMLQDALNYLQDDIMVKVDRATMSTSLESRAPLLDHKIFEYAWSMPISEKYSNGVTKKPLREILYKYVPKEMIERPKMGFGVPLESWFRHELKDWCETRLSADALRSHGLFNINPIRNAWEQHRDSSVNKQYHLWNILSFQEWYNYWSGVSTSNRNRKQH